MTDLNPLRRRLREARCALSPAQRGELDTRITTHVVRLALWSWARRVAAYQACNGEFNPATIIQTLDTLQWYLPVLTGRDQPLLFATYQPGDVLRLNPWGIAEPQMATQNLCPPEQLDVVLTPLLGFDESGFRLGMAGGFYDRSFAFRQTTAGPPWLIGVGYELQKISRQTARDWDVRLDAMITETGVYRVNSQLTL